MLSYNKNHDVLSNLFHLVELVAAFSLGIPGPEWRITRVASFDISASTPEAGC